MLYSRCVKLILGPRLHPDRRSPPGLDLMGQQQGASSLVAAGPKGGKPGSHRGNRAVGAHPSLVLLFPVNKSRGLKSCSHALHPPSPHPNSIRCQE